MLKERGNATTNQRSLSKNILLADFGVHARKEGHVARLIAPNPAQSALSIFPAKPKISSQLGVKCSSARGLWEANSVSLHCSPTGRSSLF